MIDEPFCKYCALPIEKMGECEFCAEHEFSFDEARAHGLYRGELRKAILEMKRRHSPRLAEALSMGLLAAFKAANWEVDCIVPIPLAAGRSRERGYNQAELLARPLAAHSGVPWRNDLLVRQRETLPQKGLQPGERRKNLRGAFRAERGNAQGLRVCVVDDIMTTGATLDAAAYALKRAGAKRVYALSLARTILQEATSFW
jgi:ComF family protein